MISNTTCIICLSKLNQLELLQKVYGTVMVPPTVKQEAGIPGKQGYHQIESAFEKKWLIVKTPKHCRDFGLDVGENEAINLALEEKQPIILDDYAARLVAGALGVETERTTTVLFKAVAKKIIKKNQAISFLNQLIEDGYYIAPPEYAQLLTKLTEGK